MLLNFNIELHATQVVCFCWLNSMPHELCAFVDWTLILNCCCPIKSTQLVACSSILKFNQQKHTTRGTTSTDLFAGLDLNETDSNRIQLQHSSKLNITNIHYSICSLVRHLNPIRWHIYAYMKLSYWPLFQHSPHSASPMTTGSLLVTDKQ
jgi:hypothetical protein